MDSMRLEVGIKLTHNLDGDPIVVGIYGKEAIFNCYQCNMDTFNRESLRQFFDRLVELLNMEKGDLYFWDDIGIPENEKQTKPETVGTSAIQFILTSNITVHCLDKLRRVYINIFSCKDFDEGDAQQFCQNWFGAKSVRAHMVYRE